MNTSLTWEDIGAVVGIATTVAGIGMVLIRDRLRREFAMRTDVDATTERQGAEIAGLTKKQEGLVQAVHAIEVQMGKMPTHTDMTSVFTRLSAVEAGVAGVAASLKGIDTNIGKLAHDVGLLLENGLNRDHG